MRTVDQAEQSRAPWDTFDASREHLLAQDETADFVPGLGVDAAAVAGGVEACALRATPCHGSLARRGRGV